MTSIGAGDRVRTRAGEQLGVVLRLYRTPTAILAYVRLDARPTREGQAFDVDELELSQPRSVIAPSDGTSGRPER